MPTTPNLSLPWLEAGQAQKHVTLNESLRVLDTVTQLAVAAVSASPPSEPEEGERHIVGAVPAGAFGAHANKVAAFQDGAWVFLSPRPGWRAWNADAEELLIWSGSAWTALSGGGAGDVTGPAGATDNAIARYDGTTGKLLADSPATVDDNGVISAPRMVSGNTDTTPIVGLLTEDGAGVGPIVDLERASASPADGDSLGRLNFSGRDSGGNKTDYANITAQIVEADNGNESGQIYLQTLIDGALTTVLTLGKNLFGVFAAANIGDGHLVVGDGGGKGVKQTSVTVDGDGKMSIGADSSLGQFISVSDTVPGNPGVNVWIRNNDSTGIASLATLSAANNNYNQFISFGASYASNRFGMPGAGVNEFSANGPLTIGTENNNPVRFGTNNTIKATLHAAGGFSLGTTTDPGASNISISGHFGSSIPVIISGNHTIAATTSSLICSGSGAITLTLPTASSYPGRWLYIRTVAAQVVNSASSNVIPRAGGSAGTAILPASDGAWAALQSNGTGWEIMMSS